MMVDMTPTPEQYKRMLNMILAHSTNDDDKAWAEQVLEAME
jgi:hypothetical protein